MSWQDIKLKDGQTQTFEFWEGVCRQVLDQVYNGWISDLGGLIADGYVMKIPLTWYDQYLIKQALAMYIDEASSGVRKPYEQLQDFSMNLGSVNNSVGTLTYENLKMFLPRQAKALIARTRLAILIRRPDYNANRDIDNHLEIQLEAPFYG